MSEPNTWRPSYPFLALGIVLLAVLVFVIGTMFVSDSDGPAPGNEVSNSGSNGYTNPMGQEAAPFNRGLPSLSGRVPAGGRHLEGYYTRRAYPGAPPYIPHEIDADMPAGGKLCNACHQNGGYAARFDAFTSVTPHPDFLNCRQCHVTQQKVKAAFAGSGWKRIPGPRLGQSALGSSPPRIPHTMQLRGNCSTCHGGQGAVAEIATSHPERGNCRQCHVPATVSSTWIRPEPTAN